MAIDQTARSAETPGTVRPTRPRRAGAAASDYAPLLAAVRREGLLRRRPLFYSGLAAGLLLATGAVVAGIVVLGSSPWQLALAAALGILMAQFGFVAHECAHREVFESGRANDWAGVLIGGLVVGISFTWWKGDHNRHHANPNAVGRDPSVGQGAFAFTDEDARASRGLRARYTRHQALFLFPLLLLAGLNLHVQGLAALFARGRVERRSVELPLILLRHAAFVVLVLTTMGPALGAAFTGAELAVFGVATAAAFVPNHIGMPVLPRDSSLDYLRRQVVTSRNIRGGWFTTAWMGGLNFQIEHHLFPSMPRPALRAASRMVQDHCAERGIPYTVQSLPVAYASIERELHRVGLQATARASVRCPTAAGLGR